MTGVTRIYHIATRDDWEQARAHGEYTRSTVNSTLAEEGFIHASQASQVTRTANKFYRGVPGELLVLVIDTGIHWKGWTRDQVVDFFRKSQTADEPMIQTETDRYIAWPAQALSYKLGQLKFIELRERARKELGPQFDVRKFHDEMLNGGVLPLDMLDARTNNWIKAQKSASGTPGY